METIYLLKGKFYKHTAQGFMKFTTSNDLLRQYKIVQLQRLKH